MGNQYSIELNRYLISEKDTSKLLEGIVSLDRQLKYLHQNGYYVSSINSSDIAYMINDEKEVFGFTKIERFTTQDSKNDLIEQNIEQLVYLSLGIFVYLMMGENGNFYDYTIIEKKYPNYIKENYGGIRQAIPYGREYYDEIILNNKYDYFSDYIDKVNKTNTSKGNTQRLVKATPTGRALAEKEDAAFVKVIYYPVLITCIFILTTMIYLFYLFL